MRRYRWLLVSAVVVAALATASAGSINDFTILPPADNFNFQFANNGFFGTTLITNDLNFTPVNVPFFAGPNAVDLNYSFDNWSFLGSQFFGEGPGFPLQSSLLGSPPPPPASSVPEPASMILLGSGLLIAALLGKRLLQRQQLRRHWADEQSAAPGTSPRSAQSELHLVAPPDGNHREIA